MLNRPIASRSGSLAGVGRSNSAARPRRSSRIWCKPPSCPGPGARYCPASGRRRQLRCGGTVQWSNRSATVERRASGCARVSPAARDRARVVAWAVDPRAGRSGASGAPSLSALAPHRRRSRPFRDPALEPSDQLGRLFLIEQAADRRVRYQRSSGLIEFVALRKVRTLIDALHGRAQAGLNDARGIQDDDAKKPAPGPACST